MSDHILKRADRITIDPWKRVLNKFSQDASISLELRGFILYCISLPENWEFHASHLAKVNNLNIKKCYALIQEGIEAGYIARETIKIGNLNNGISYRFSDDKEDIKNMSPTQPKCAVPEEQFEKDESSLMNPNIKINSPTQSISGTPKNDTLQTIDNERKEETLRNDTEKNRLSKSPISTVHFFPAGYKLMNGQTLSLRTQRSLAKYKGDDYVKLCANVKAYEEYCKTAKEIGDHEKTLQWCIKVDLSSKMVDSMRNRFYAMYMFEEAKLRDHIRCFKTMIKIEDKHGTVDTVQLSQSQHSFKETILHYIRKIKGH